MKNAKPVKEMSRGDELLRLGIALLFVIGVIFYAMSVTVGGVSMMLVVASVVGAYMAMNIGANDVAN
ncbi:MAG: inorganic phosphate transporter, partial [Pseudohongiella sp.]|nr:inorganic phosphate transporter [Pseudohongiella sp.]